MLLHQSVRRNFNVRVREGKCSHNDIKDKNITIMSRLKTNHMNAFVQYYSMFYGHCVTSMLFKRKFAKIKLNFNNFF